jgi:prepilin-type processing-associated H-X9-DG protein
LFGPLNYAACAGSGMGGGTPANTDGVFFVNSKLRLGQVTDGTSKTSMFSEGLLGVPSPGPTHDVHYEYKFVIKAPLTDTLCAGATQWNVTDPRGFAWVDGEYRCGLYNHYYPPNYSLPDCIGVVSSGGAPNIAYTPFGWRTARSNHPGGVNMAFVDGSVRFVTDDVDSTVWVAAATRAGNEVADPP